MLMTTEALAAALDDDGIAILDASYHPLDTSRDPAAEHARAHIPNARFLDLAGLGDAARYGMRAPAARIAARLEALGAGGRRILLYDDSAQRTAARAWWLLHSYGIDDVALLDGGLAKWRAERRPLTDAAPPERPSRAPVAPAPREAVVRDLAAMRANLATHEAIVADARSVVRFAGIEHDPRPGIAPGHIPGSYNLPYGELFHADGSWKRGAALRAAYEEAGVDLDRPLITTCGSGVTAAVLAFGAALLGKTDVALYDGSWREWGAHPDTPKALHA